MWELEQELEKLRTGTYECQRQDRSPYYECLQNQVVVNTFRKLCDFTDTFSRELQLYQVLTFDLGGFGTIPDIIVIQALGGKCWVIEVHKVLVDMEMDAHTREPLIDSDWKDRIKDRFVRRLEDLLEAIESPNCLVIGCQVQKVVAQLMKAFNIKMDLQKVQNVFDTTELFKFNKEN